jgi:hypothetical protein
LVFDDLPEVPRPEIPRPDFARADWVSLNGPWEFSFDPNNLGEQQRWHRYNPPEDIFRLRINVPFPWESLLSGVSAPEYKGAGWYRREIEVPGDWQERGLRPILKFGAADWLTRVWARGRLLCEHEGGYDPFEVDLTHFAGSSAPTPIVVRCWDVSAGEALLGKQTYDWYTPSSGIWQPVWLEGVPETHLEKIHFTPDVRNEQVHVRATVRGASEGCVLRLTFDGNAAPPVEHPVTGTLTEFSARIPSPKVWSPGSPFLYEVTAEVADRSGRVFDMVRTYFGMRTVSVGRLPGRDYEYIYLNGEPCYLRGALDQAFTPDALHSYRSDAVIRGDIEIAKRFGLNMLRCHIKVNDPRYYYWADKLGMWVMYDLPSPGLYTPMSRSHWQRTLRAAIDRDYNHPSIFSWILFNETWGLEEHQMSASWQFVSDMVDLCKELDQTRLVEDNSACLYDHVKTDINTWHFYINDHDRARQHVERVVRETYPGSAFNFVGGEYAQETQPLLNSEYAGIAAADGDKDISHSFRFLTSELRRHDKICGYVYTELADVEWEHNGYVNYDRSEKEYGYDHFCPGMTPADLNGGDFVGVDAPPCQTIAPGQEFRAPLFFSHWGEKALEEVTVRWTWRFTNSRGAQREFARGERTLAPERWTVNDVGHLEQRLPEEPGLAVAAIEVHGPQGIVARNYQTVEVYDVFAPPPPVQRVADGWALTWTPAHFSQSTFAQPGTAPQGEKLTVRGPGVVSFTLPLPQGLEPAQARAGRLIFEAAAASAQSRLDWRQKARGDDYPQTEVNRKIPTGLAVSVNGVEVADLILPDDPADARGVLSYNFADDYQPGSYGFLNDIAISEEQMCEIRENAMEGGWVVTFSVPQDARMRTGFRLYGRRMGAYPVPPTLLLLE